jgi:hypothetical protein
MPRLPLPPKPLTEQPPDGPFATPENIQAWYAWVAGKSRVVRSVRAEVPPS